MNPVKSLALAVLKSALGWDSRQACLLCGAPALAPPLCDACRGELLPLDLPGCPFCGEPLISRQDCCGSCREDPFPASSGFSLYPYRGGPRELLSLYKQGDCKELSDFFAGELFARRLSLKPLPLVPVPRSEKNFRRRGWDPVDRLCRSLSRNYGFSCRPLLKRLPSPSQKELSRQDRLTNLRGKVVPRRRLKEIPREVYLIDDVWTTGSTLRECIGVLKRMGVESVHGVSLVRD